MNEDEIKQMIDLVCKFVTWDEKSEDEKVCMLIEKMDPETYMKFDGLLDWFGGSLDNIEGEE